MSAEIVNLHEEMRAAQDEKYDAALALYHATNDGETPGFVVRDEPSADWALRKLAGVEKAAEAVNLLANDEVERVEMWRSDELRRLSDDSAFFRHVLAAFHQRVLEGSPGRKTIRLPHGKLTARRSPDRWEFDDEAFILWANAHADTLVRIKLEVDKAEAKRLLVAGEVVTTKDGQIADGVTVVPGEVRFTADPEVER